MELGLGIKRSKTLGRHGKFSLAFLSFNGVSFKFYNFLRYFLGNTIINAFKNG